jgi:hypothetical protein
MSTASTRLKAERPSPSGPRRPSKREMNQDFFTSRVSPSPHQSFFTLSAAIFVCNRVLYGRKRERKTLISLETTRPGFSTAQRSFAFPFRDLSTLPPSTSVLVSGTTAKQRLIDIPTTRPSPCLVDSECVMAAAVPAELKAISPYLARATELEKAEPVISYWCECSIRSALARSGVSVDLVGSPCLRLVADGCPTQARTMRSSRQCRSGPRIPRVRSICSD